MINSKKFKLALPNNQYKEFSINFLTLRKIPDLFIDILNNLSNIITVAFFLFVFISQVFGFTFDSEVAMIIVIYSYVIVIAFLQFSKLILGGDKFFPKVGYDIAILGLPILIILPLLISGNLNIGMFGVMSIWSTSGITLLSFVLLSYVLAINYSYKSGLRSLQFMLDIGLIVAVLARFIIPELVIADIDFLMVLLTPYYFSRLNLDRSWRLKITGIVNLVFGLFFFITGDFLNNNLLEAEWSRDTFLFIFVIFVILIQFVKVILNRKKVIKDIKKIIADGEIILPYKSLNKELALKILKYLGFTLITIHLFITGFIGEIISSLFTTISETLAFDSFIKLLFGNGISAETTFFASLLDKLGVISFILIVGILSLIVISEIRKSKNLTMERTVFIFGQILLIITGFFFELSTLLLFVYFIFISLSMISNRSGENRFENYTFLRLTSIKDKNIRYAIYGLKFLIILISFFGVLVLVSSIGTVINTNLIS